MTPVHIVIHPAVPLADIQKVHDLVTFARKVLGEFPVEGETPVAQMEPWGNTREDFAMILGVKVPADRLTQATMEDRRRALEAFAKQHYPHFTLSVVLTDPGAAPKALPGQERP